MKGDFKGIKCEMNASCRQYPINMELGMAWDICDLAGCGDVIAMGEDIIWCGKDMELQRDGGVYHSGLIILLPWSPEINWQEEPRTIISIDLITSLSALYFPR